MRPEEFEIHKIGFTTDVRAFISYEQELVAFLQQDAFIASFHIIGTFRRFEYSYTARKLAY